MDRSLCGEGWAAEHPEGRAVSSRVSAACQKLSILRLGIEVEVSEGPEIPDPVKMSGFTSSESSLRSSRLEPGVVGRAEGPSGARWAQRALLGLQEQSCPWQDRSASGELAAGSCECCQSASWRELQPAGMQGRVSRNSILGCCGKSRGYLTS